MKILVQWTRAAPGDWEEATSEGWGLLPVKPLPIGGEPIDALPGWVHYVNVQGVVFTADHYAVEDLPGGACRVTAWNDDLEDYAMGERFAQVWTFLPLAPDARFGGAYNTRQSRIVYAEDAVRARFEAHGPVENTTILPWADFVPPSVLLTRHGIWTTNALNDQHVAALPTRWWREWTAGVPAEEIVAGSVRTQRPHGRYDRPTGTKTLFQRNTDLATALHAAIAVANENELNATAGAGETEASGAVAGGGNGILFVFTGPTGFPNMDAWGTGTFRCQLDVSAAGATITYGLLNQTSAGHFARVASGLASELETKQQAEAAFSGTGLKLATTGSVTWAAGSAGDRFECCVSGARPASHGNETVTLTFDADAFIDGPWFELRYVQDPMLLRDTVTAKSPLTPTEGVTDNFNDNSRDLAKWSLGTVLLTDNPNVLADETNQQLKITTDSLTIGYGGYTSRGFFNMTGSFVRVEVVQVAVFDVTETVLIFGPANNVYARMYVVGVAPLLTFERTNPLVSSSIAYDVVAHHHWRIRHEPADDTFRFETSPDALTWTQRESFARTFDITAVRLELLAGSTDTESADLVAFLDNFNTTASQVYSRPVQDRLLLADLLTATKITPAGAQVFERLIQDGILMADAPKRDQHMHLREPLLLADQARQEAARIQAILDSMLLADQARQQAEHPVIVQGQLLLSDAQRRTVEAARLLADTILLRETPVVTADRRREVLDALLLSDLVTADKIAGGAAQVITRLVQDTLLLADNYRREREHVVRASIGLADAAVLERHLILRERVVLLDEIGREALRLRAILDLVATMDATAATAIRMRLVADAVPLADAVRKVQEMVIRAPISMVDAVTGSVLSAVIQMLTGVALGTVDPLGRSRDVLFRDPLARVTGGRTRDPVGRAIGWRNT